MPEALGPRRDRRSAWSFIPAVGACLTEHTYRDAKLRTNFSPGANYPADQEERQSFRRQEQRRKFYRNWYLVPMLRANRSPETCLSKTLIQTAVIVTGSGPRTTNETPRFRSCPCQVPNTFTRSLISELSPPNRLTLFDSCPSRLIVLNRPFPIPIVADAPVRIPH